jgi:hypothetical protein
MCKLKFIYTNTSKLYNYTVSIKVYITTHDLRRLHRLLGRVTYCTFILMPGCFGVGCRDSLSGLIVNKETAFDVKC